MSLLKSSYWKASEKRVTFVMMMIAVLIGGAVGGINGIIASFVCGFIGGYAVTGIIAVMFGIDYQTFDRTCCLVAQSTFLGGSLASVIVSGTVAGILGGIASILIFFLYASDERS